MSFFLEAESEGFHSRFNTRDRPPLVVRVEVGISVEFKQGMGSHLQMRWETRGSCQLVAGTSAFISSCDGDPGPP